MFSPHSELTFAIDIQSFLRYIKEENLPFIVPIVSAISLTIK